MSVITGFLLSVLFLLWLASVAFYAVSLYCARSFFAASGAGDKAAPGELPPMSVLKPIMGADEDTYDNLKSFVEQDYPDFEVIFGVADLDDPSVRIIRRLISDYPDSKLSLVNSIGIEAPNRKVANLISMFRKAENGIIVVADADMRVGQDYLKALAADFEPGGVGIVTCPYRGAYPEDIGSAFEALTIDTDFIPSVTVARTLEGMSFALGATMAVRREALNDIGGFEALSDYLADDYMLGNLVRHAGYEIVLSRYIVDAVGRNGTFREYFRHQLRWGRTYRACRPKGYLMSGLTKGTAFATLFLVVSGFTAGGLALFLFNLALRYIQANHIEHALIRGPGVGAWMWLLPVKDLAGFVIWATSLVGNAVAWKDRKFRIDGEGRMVPVNSA